MAHGQTPVRRLLLTGAALVALGACDDFDPDLRGIGNGLDTSRAVQDMPGRPRPDDRGVITYPTYQVVVAQQDDTIRGIAIRLGLDANELATFNGIEPDVVLRRDEIIALPGRLPDAGAAPAAAGQQPLDVSAVATGALERAGTVTATPLDPATPATASAAPAPATPAGPEPIRHQVQRGETVFALSRLYGVPVRTIAEWNGLDSAFTVRTGQYLLIPRTAAPAPTAQVVEAPGAGSATPVPPSASTPLPNERPSAPLPATATPPAPDLGTPSAPSSSARLVMPVQGSIIRAYAPGTNEGIDIAAPAGTPVKAADAGTVAAVTTNTEGVAIVVIKHNDGLLTVYTFIDELAVNKNDSVSRGQTIAKVASGNPSFLHFEARRGLQSVDPTTLLP